MEKNCVFVRSAAAGENLYVLRLCHRREIIYYIFERSAAGENFERIKIAPQAKKLYERSAAGEKIVLVPL